MYSSVQLKKINKKIEKKIEFHFITFAVRSMTWVNRFISRRFKNESRHTIWCHFWSNYRFSIDGAGPHSLTCIDGHRNLQLTSDETIRVADVRVRVLFHVSFLYFSSSKMSALNLTVRVHPLVLFQVVDAFERRNADSQRVIGTLLGESSNEYVHRAKLIPLPHQFRFGRQRRCWGYQLLLCAAQRTRRSSGSWTQLRARFIWSESTCEFIGNHCRWVK